MDLGIHAGGEGSDSALRSAGELIRIDHGLGRLRETIPRYSLALAAGLKRLPPTAPIILDLRLRLAHGYHLIGDWAQSMAALKSVLADADEKTMSALVGKAELYYGQLLTDLSESTSAQVQLRNAVTQLTSTLGNQHELVAEARADLGKSLADSGRYAEAQAELKVAQELGTRWAPPDTWTVVRPRYFTALMQLQQDEPAKAERILAEIIAYDDSLNAAYYERHKGLPAEPDSSGPVRQALGEAYARQGKFVEANATLQKAVELTELAEGPGHPTALSTRLALAEVLLAQRRNGEAQRLLASVPIAELNALPATHPIVAQWHRVSGLLALEQNNRAEARKSLSDVLQIYQALYGARHWRTIRANEELSLSNGKDEAL
jgi:hypothetical protein